MADRPTAEERLARLRELILHARAMPMSASCVVNRGDVLAAIDEVIDSLPQEIAEAQLVIEAAEERVAEGEATAARIIEEARQQAAEVAENSEVVQQAEEAAAKLRSDAEADAAALRHETDVYVDARLAAFESVLHKTTSQVRTARARLAERSGLDGSGTGKVEARSGLTV